MYRYAFAVLASITMTAQAQPNNQIKHRMLEVNGIRMHIAEQGEGPLVLLLHGFPELWYSSRHLLPALAAAGYHAVAPDMRGYGQSDAPANPEEYSQLKIAGDIVGLVQALGYDKAVISGHDWGAPAAYTAANLRPDMFRAVVLLSVPFSVRQPGGLKPTEGMKRMMPPGKVFYQTYFQQPGVAEKELEADAAKTMRILLGTVAEPGKWRYILNEGEGFLSGREVPAKLPPWLTEEDVAVYAKEYARTGFRGGLNWYRSQDITWSQTGFLVGRKLLQPTLFITGTNDLVYEFARAGVDNLEKAVPNLWKKVILKGVGHWTEQEAPADVNRLFIEFLQSLDKK